MTLKDYCKAHHISIRQLSQRCAIPYSTLSDLINQKTDSFRVSFGVICALSDELAISLDDMRKMLGSGHAMHNGDTAPYMVIIRNKCYYFEIPGEPREYLCKVPPITQRCIDEIASWRYRDYIKQKEMEELTNVLRTHA